MCGVVPDWWEVWLPISFSTENLNGAGCLCLSALESRRECQPFSDLGMEPTWEAIVSVPLRTTCEWCSTSLRRSFSYGQWGHELSTLQRDSPGVQGRSWRRLKLKPASVRHISADNCSSSKVILIFPGCFFFFVNIIKHVGWLTLFSSSFIGLLSFYVKWQIHSPSRNHRIYPCSWPTTTRSHK